MYIYMICVHVHVKRARHARTHITYKCTYIICVHVHVARARHARAHITYKCTHILTGYGILIYS